LIYTLNKTPPIFTCAKVALTRYRNKRPCLPCNVGRHFSRCQS